MDVGNELLLPGALWSDELGSRESDGSAAPLEVVGDVTGSDESDSVETCEIGGTDWEFWPDTRTLELPAEGPLADAG